MEYSITSIRGGIGFYSKKLQIQDYSSSSYICFRSYSDHNERFYGFGIRLALSN